MPVLLAVVGSILALAGLLILTSRRSRGITVLGASVLLVGLVAISPTTVSSTTNTAVTATSEAIAGIMERPGPAPEPVAGEIVAVETPEAP